jgi:hypothetical protein
MATFNSKPARRLRLTALGVFVAIFTLSCQVILADDAQTKIFVARDEAEYNRTQKLYEGNDNTTNAIQFAKACFDYADICSNDSERASIASLGIAACRRLIASDAKSAPAHYYLGMNLGEQARTEFLGALRIVREMEREFTTAATLDKQYDHAGPERCLGLLYRDAPGWPASIGSNRKAKKNLEQAVTIASDYPENILNLAESDFKWHDNKTAQKELDTLDAMWPQAQKQFVGDAWAQNWADWTNRRDALRQSLSGTKPSS